MPNENGSTPPTSATRGKESEKEIGKDILHLAEGLDLRRAELASLLRVLRDALAMRPPLYLNALAGTPLDWVSSHRHSELRVLSLRDLARGARYLADIAIPALPFQIPRRLPGIGTAVFWRPTRVLFEPGYGDDPYSFDDEAWIFVNGMATNPSLARINAQYLVQIFHRPLTIIQNATDSVGVDLVESIIGKAWGVFTEPAAKAYPFIAHALRNPKKKRVVVICHSQGTIILSNVLRALLDEEHREKLQESAKRQARLRGAAAEDIRLEGLTSQYDLHKLEIYAFANCADFMCQLPNARTAAGSRVPFIESFGNEHDLVARLGMLAPNADRHGIHLDGDHYRRDGKWGHFLNLHYLKGMERYLRRIAAGRDEENPYRFLRRSEHSASTDEEAVHTSADDGDDPAAERRPRLYGYYAGAMQDPY